MPVKLLTRITFGHHYGGFGCRALRTHTLPKIFPRSNWRSTYVVEAKLARLRSVAVDSIAGYKIGGIGAKIREALRMSGPIRGFS